MRSYGHLGPKVLRLVEPVACRTTIRKATQLDLIVGSILVGGLLLVEAGARAVFATLKKQEILGAAGLGRKIVDAR